MARKRMVTRSIKTTELGVMCVDTQAGETFTKVVSLPATYKSDEQALKAVKTVIEVVDNIKAVAIVSTKVEENLYGMLESEFIQQAKILPPRFAEENAEA